MKILSLKKNWVELQSVNGKRNMFFDPSVIISLVLKELTTHDGISLSVMMSIQIKQVILIATIDEKVTTTEEYFIIREIYSNRNQSSNLIRFKEKVKKTTTAKNPNARYKSKGELDKFSKSYVQNTRFANFYVFYIIINAIKEGLKMKIILSNQI